MSMAGQNRISQDSRAAMRNPWVIGWILLVVVVLGVNAGMITLAITTNPGLVEEDYYEKGRDYERNMQTRKDARSALGWEVALEVPERLALNEPREFRLHIRDRVGLPVRQAHVTLTAYRPSDASADFELQLEEIQPGIYASRFALPLKGLWDLNARVEHGEDVFTLSRRVSVRSL